jgi:hypothetical protein
MDKKEPNCKCVNCGKSWISRVPNPLQCPRCKSIDWKDRNIVRYCNYGYKRKCPRVAEYWIPARWGSFPRCEIHSRNNPERVHIKKRKNEILSLQTTA